MVKLLESTWKPLTLVVYDSPATLLKNSQVSCGSSNFIQILTLQFAPMEAASSLDAFWKAGKSCPAKIAEKPNERACAGTTAKPSTA